MASIYKKKRDKGQRGACYFIDYTDHTGKRRTKKGFTDRQATMQLASKLEQEAMKRKAGLIDSVEEELANHRRLKITDHLEAFRTFLESGDNTAKHVRTVTSRIQTIIDVCEAVTLKDLTAEKVEAFLVEHRKETGIGPRTITCRLSILSPTGWWNESG